MNKLEKARRILIESGWFRDYYFIIKVMEGNRSGTNILWETETRRWGWAALDRKLLMLKDKHPKLRTEFSNLTYWYFHELSNRHESILFEITDNLCKDVEKPEEDKKPSSVDDAIYYVDL